MAPAEIITNAEELVRPLAGMAFSRCASERFRPKDARERLLRHFETASPDALGFSAANQPAMCAAGALMAYLNDTQKNALGHITRIQFVTAGHTMPLDQNTIRNLELTQTLRGQSGKGTLLSVLDHTVTAMGGRLLRSYVEQPLLLPEEINARLDAVEALVREPVLCEAVRERLQQVYDMERLLAKVTVHLSCEWEGAAIRSVHVRNLNRVLRPFGEAVMAEDWDQQEFHAGAGTASGTFVFYVPENRQGTIDGIRTSREKSPDANDEVRNRSSRLTYLETTVEGTGVYAGTIVYRSFLGQNAVSDFDLRRNARYDWTIRYLSDGLQYDDWKHDNDLIDTQSGLHIADGWDDGGETDLN